MAELAGAVMSLVNLIRRGQARSFNPELVAVLELLRTGDGLTPSEIADALPAPRSSVSRRIQALSERGWVNVVEDAADRRSYLVRLAPAGAAELDRLTAEGLVVFGEMVADWSAEDIRTYTTLTRRLATVRAPEAARKRRGAWWREEQP